MNEQCTDLAQFIPGEVDPGTFPHREHVRMGFEMLRRYNFEEAAEHSDFASFAGANPDLIDKSALKRWYRPERLAMDAARRTFLLPDPHSTGDRP